jgi:K+-sensing histidine kinase KdpD
MTNFLVKTLLTPEHKKYIEPLRENNMLIIKTINNAADYCKISSGAVELNIEDFYFTRAITEIEKINTAAYIKVKFMKSRDVILSTDYKKFIEMIMHVLSYSFSNKLEVFVLSSVKNDTFEMYFKDNGPRISKYQRDTVFEGFIHEDTSNKSLSMPIARGIALLLGGDLAVDSSIEYGTTFKFTMKTRDVESD